VTRASHVGLLLASLTITHVHDECRSRRGDAAADLHFEAVEHNQAEGGHLADVVEETLLVKYGCHVGAARDIPTAIEVGLAVGPHVEQLIEKGHRRRRPACVLREKGMCRFEA